MKLKITVIMMIAALILISLSGCSAAFPRAYQSGDSSVTVSVVTEDGQTIVASEQVGIAPGNTVFNVTAFVLKEHNVSFSFTGTGDGVYIKEINGLAEFSQGVQSGWIFYVDSVTATQSCGGYALSGNEEIKWVFVTKQTF